MITAQRRCGAGAEAWIIGKPLFELATRGSMCLAINHRIFVKTKTFPPGEHFKLNDLLAYFF
jgi:hypothetical protein